VKAGAWVFMHASLAAARKSFNQAESGSRDDDGDEPTLQSPSAGAGPGASHARTDRRPMSTPATPYPQVFPTWAELAAAAKAGDARARDFLLTFVPWLDALHDDRKPKN
jgi:hypothetical protein